MYVKKIMTNRGKPPYVCRWKEWMRSIKKSVINPLLHKFSERLTKKYSNGGLEVKPRDTLNLIL